MRREWILLGATTVVTVLLVLGLVRWFAPGLLGIPTDLQMVRVSEKIPPFFEGVFRADDYETGEFILKDPYTHVRARPLFPELGSLGPHDILGFRNRQVPNVADVVVIGDSQTYGNNAILDENWPSQLSQILSDKQATVYAMAVGGWGAVQYLDMFYNAVTLQPRVVVVAFYTGNDPLESFSMAYNNDRWAELRLNEQLDKTNRPKSAWPAPESEWWPVRFRDGAETIFTPKLRYSSNQAHPAVEAGYDIMARVAEVITELAHKTGAQAVFTVIPTKELAYRRRVEREEIEAPADYLQLVETESENISGLSQKLRSIPNAKYVDVVEPLQEAATHAVSLYPQDTNGHPLAAGYRVIAHAMAAALRDLLPEPITGPVAVQVGKDKDQYQVYIVKDRQAWLVPNRELIRRNGWSDENVPIVTARDIAGLAKGMIDDANPQKFGPTGL